MIMVAPIGCHLHLLLIKTLGDPSFIILDHDQAKTLYEDTHPATQTNAAALAQSTRGSHDLKPKTTRIDALANSRHAPE